jgi:SAM-dependent methyltransferase
MNAGMNALPSEAGPERKRDGANSTRRPGEAGAGCRRLRCRVFARISLNRTAGNVGTVLPLADLQQDGDQHDDVRQAFFTSARRPDRRRKAGACPSSQARTSCFSMAYADITTRDSNPIKRWLQRRRFTDALAVLAHADATAKLRVLDFGAGDGELVRQMVATTSVEPWVYEPTPSLMAEAREKLAAFGSVRFADDLGLIESQSFDCIFSLEVFEHLPEKETALALAEIHRLLKPAGIAVIGVPHELFLPALFKGVFRASRRYGEFDAIPGNIFKALTGHPPLQRPVAEIHPGLRYHFHHLGFDFRVLEHTLMQDFQLRRKWFSPVPMLGAVLNSEVYFLLQKANCYVTTDAAR